MKQKVAIIMLGLPLSGKSTWILENKVEDDFTKVSADDYKPEHPDYNPEDVTKEVHEWSVAKAETEMEELSDLGENIVMDSGSINNRYTIRIIKMLKSKGYFIKLVWVKTPYTVCLERNASQVRERKVPAKAITDKALKQTSQFHKLEQLVDDTHVEDYFTNKHIFIDMDGVIAAQSCLPIINGEIDFVNGEVHKWLKPVTPVIDRLRNLALFGCNLHILSATPNSFSSQEKQDWLDLHFDIPKERRFFVNQGRHKAEMLDNLVRKFKYDKKDVLMIDDMHDILYKVIERGMNAMHPSEFLTHDFYDN